MIKRFFSRLVLPLVLAGACGWLGWHVFQQWQTPGDLTLLDPPAEEELAAEVVSLPPMPRFQMPPANRFEQILARPLFSESRRPFKPEVKTVETKKEPPKELKVKVMGIITTDDRKTALVVEEGTTNTKRIEEGEVFNGWTLEAIENEALHFSKNGKLEEVPIIYDEVVVQPKPKKKQRRRRRNQRQIQTDGSTQQDQDASTEEEQNQ